MRLVITFLACALAPPVIAQQLPVSRTTTTGVVIDVSVVDRKGQAIVDLKPDEFELQEDGKRQQLLSVTIVDGGAVRPLDVPAGAVPTPTQPAVLPTTTEPARAAGGPDTTPTATAILFDRLSPEVRPFGARAALAYLSTLTPRDYAGVFLADVKLVTLAPFSNQLPALRSGIERVASTAPAMVSPSSERAGYSRVQQMPLDPNVPATAGAESGVGWVDPLERSKFLGGLVERPVDSEILMRRMELRMFETYQQFLAEFEGQASLAGLRSVVDSMRVLPGRKSVLYFTESLKITDRLKPKFDAVIDEANRSNITIYTVDAAGLRVHSKEAEVGRNVNTAGAQGVGDVQRGEGAWTKELEKQEQIVSSSGALGRLAKDTGGFLLENTNDLGAGIARIQQERTTYYLLAYQPTNTALDGKFRRVSVKVKRPGVTIRARPGYVAAR